MSEVSVAGDVISSSVLTSYAHMLGPWNLFWSSDWMIKLIMMILCGMSIAAWSIFISKWRQLRFYARASVDFENIFWQSDDLHSLWRMMQRQTIQDPMRHIFVQVMDEWSIPVDRDAVGLSSASAQHATLFSRLERAINMTHASEMADVQKNLGWLATMTSTAPFVGLLGTVWGIMNCFSAIAGAESAHLAVIAPGIAEALVTMVLGLVVAIPASVFFNILSDGISDLDDRLSVFSQHVKIVLLRHLSKK